MARQFLLLFACIFALNVSLVLSREDYYQHFSNIFSHHHRRSTPDADVVSTEIPVTVTGGMPHADASRSTINYAKKTTGERVEVIQKGWGIDSDEWKDNWEDIRNRNRQTLDDAYTASVAVMITSIVLSLASLTIGLLIIFCCGKKIGRKVRSGFVVNANSGGLGGVQARPPAFAPSQQMTHSPGGVELQKVPLS